MAMRSPKRSFSRDAKTGVSEISGTSSNACSPRFTDLPHQLDVDLGLPAAGHAFEQKRRERADSAGLHRRDGRALFLGVPDLARRRLAESGQEGVERVPPRAPFDAHDALLHERRQHGRADAAMFERAHRKLAAARLQQIHRASAASASGPRVAFEHDEPVVAHAFRVAAGREWR